MKHTTILIAIAAVVSTLPMHAAAPDALPAPMPEFMDQAQMAKWNADREAASATTTASSQTSTQFYTGKPYIADAGGYIFKYRTYNPEIARWTSADPSGFPDGVNNVRYVSRPTSQFDNLGLTTINSFSDAMNYWHRSGGSTSDTVTLGADIISDIKNSDGFQDLVSRMQDQRITPQLQAVDQSTSDGGLTPNTGMGPADIGYVDSVVGRTSVSYSDSTSWHGSGWTTTGSGNRQYRVVTGSTEMDATLSDTFNFTDNPNDSWFMNLIEEDIPGFIAGAGTAFNMNASFEYDFTTQTAQYKE